MYPVAHAVGLRVIAHLLDVPFQRIKVQHQTGCLDIRLSHAGKGGDVVADFKSFEFRMCVHVVSLSSRDGCPDLHCHR